MKSILTLKSFLLWTGFLFAFGSVGWAAVPGRPDRTQIVFGYMQNTEAAGPLTGYRWHALTHVAYTAVAFGPDGGLIGDSVRRWQNRSPELKAGGAAANNGVKVVVTITNTGFQESVASAVFGNPQRRSRLAREVTALVADPATGCDGVTLDIEPMSFKPAIAAGFAEFLRELAPALRALQPRRELTMYVGAYRSAWFSLTDFRNCLDLILYSGYDFADGKTVADVGFIGSIEKGIDSWLAAGWPPERIVLLLPLYGKAWRTANPSWGAEGEKAGAIGMDRGNFDISLRQPALTAYPSGPQRSCVYTADPTTGGKWIVRTFDDPQSHARKLAMAQKWTGTVRPGVQLGGVGFWSLMWLAQGPKGQSIDPNAPERGAINQRRTYRVPWTLWEEMFSPPGQAPFRAETFEGASLNPCWADPNGGPDDLNAAESSSLTMTDIAPGGPAGSQRAARLQFNFIGSPGRLFVKYKLLCDAAAPHPVDMNAALVLTDATTEFAVPIYNATALPGCTVRIVVADTKRELERSAPLSLNTPGWQWLRLDLTAPGAVTGYTTREAAYKSGNGIIETRGTGTRDVSFAGFEIEAAGPGSGVIDFDGILYREAGR